MRQIIPDKVLDYTGRNVSGGAIRGKIEFAWPVAIWRVSLPKRCWSGTERDNALNPFEKAVIGLLCESRMEIDELAEVTALPKDLLEFILNRLVDKGYLNEHFELTESGKAHINPDAEMRIEGFQNFVLFQELVSKTLLPMILEANDALATEEVSESNNRKVVIQKKSHPISLNKLSVQNNGDLPAPNINSVLSIFQQVKRQQSVTRFVSPHGNFLNLPSIENIVLSPAPEYYYLRTLLLFPKNSTDFRFANPFGRDEFSSHLELAFRELLAKDKKTEEWFHKKKEYLVSNAKPSDRKESGINDTISDFRYPELSLKKIYSDYQESRGSLSEASALQDVHHAQERFIKNVYSAIEWAFFYCNKEKPTALAENILRMNSSPDENEKYLISAAKEIGFLVRKDEIGSLLKLKLGRIAESAKNADMTTALSLALATAKNDTGKRHPLRELAKKIPEFLTSISKLKRQRDPLQHGKKLDKENEIKNADIEDGMSLLETTLKILLPTLKLPNRPDKTEAFQSASTSDIRFAAQTELEGFFGYGTFQKFSDLLRDLLISIEIPFITKQFATSNDTSTTNAQELISDLAAALQATFRKMLSERISPKVEPEQYIHIAEKNVRNTGMLHQNQKFPDTFALVRPEMVKITLSGNDQTLGACVIAFLLVATEEELVLCAQRQPDFLSGIAEIIALRGHGNQTILLTGSQLGKIKQNTFTTIQNLHEL